MQNNKPAFINVIPPLNELNLKDYYPMVMEYIKKCSDLGFKNSLITTGPERFDPWVVAQLGMTLSGSFSPIVAINPFDHHPAMVAKKLLTLNEFYSNHVSLNLVTGAYLSSQISMSDELSLETSAKRLVEFYQAVDELLLQKNYGTFEGSFYQFNNAKVLKTSKPYRPEYFLSGSFVEALSGEKSNLNYVQNIKPLSMIDKVEGLYSSGLNVGLFVRETAEQACHDFNNYFTIDRKGQILFELSFKHKKTPWIIWLKNYLKKEKVDHSSYNLIPMLNSKSFAPYLVGSYKDVKEILKSYSELGYAFFIIDFPPSDIDHIRNFLKQY